MKNLYLLKFNKLIFAILFLVFSLQSDAQYCTPTNAAGNCATTDIITSVKIKGTALNNSVSTCNGVSRWNTYAANGSTTATLYSTAGANTYQISISTSSTDIVSMWIDYDQSGTFDSVIEWKQLGTNNTANKVYTFSFTVPTNAKLGKTGMRIRSRLSGNTNDSTFGCKTTGSGVCHDYTVTIDTLTACTGTPTTGTVVSTSDSVCSGNSFVLSISGGTYGSGQTFQWQSSTDSVNWSDMKNDTNITVTTSTTALIYYRYYTVCNNSGNADTSQFITIYLNPFNVCYCTPTNLTACAVTDMISNVAIVGTTLNNIVTTCNSGGTRYNKYTPANNQTATLYSTAGYNTYTLSVTSTATSIISAWIDYDQNGTFDASEWVQVTTSSTANNAATVSITVPTTATLGTTGLRIRTRASAAVNGANSACTTFANGITHDYVITIDSISNCSSSIKAGYISSSSSSVCPNNNVVLTINGGTFGIGQTIQWQTSADSINWSDISGATTLSLTTTLNTKTYYRYYTVCSNTYSDTSAGILVNISSLSACYCIPTHPTCTSTDKITNVTIQGTTLNNSPQSCPNGAVNPYFVFSPKNSTTANLIQGQSYTLDVTTSNNNIISVWIDYNQNGTFDSIEWTQVCTTSTAKQAALVLQSHRQHYQEKLV